jgi:hypothetical protein
MSEASTAQGAPAADESSVAYQPKPPLWRPPWERRRSTAAIVGWAVALLTGSLLLTLPFLEKDIFATPAHATRVTILAVENTGHPDEDTPMHFQYSVVLPDGSRGRLSSQLLHRPGAHLLAMVSRGRFTGRVFVSAPYRALDQER